MIAEFGLAALWLAAALAVLQLVRARFAGVRGDGRRTGRDRPPGRGGAGGAGRAVAFLLLLWALRASPTFRSSWWRAIRIR